MKTKTTRLYSLDVLRVISALAVFLFHSRIHIGINYRLFNHFIGNCHIFMVAFFMLSGFSLFYAESGKTAPMDNNIHGGGVNHSFSIAS